jgi:hypothetical protein
LFPGFTKATITPGLAADAAVRRRHVRMKPIDRFQTEFKRINATIQSFNQYLALDKQVPTFDLDTGIEQKQIVIILHKDWDAFPFPNNATRGVYFVFGHEIESSGNNGVYIGKASFESTTSDRLYAHLHPYRTKEHFTMKNCKGDVYILDAMASINLDLKRLQMPFMASALEEYLIVNLKDRLNLLNGTGNS